MVYDFRPLQVRDHVEGLLQHEVAALGSAVGIEIKPHQVIRGIVEPIGPGGADAEEAILAR